MSRIGKLPISVPDTVQVTKQDSIIHVKGPLGMLCMPYNPTVNVSIQDDQVILSPTSPESRKLWGTYRTLIEQMVIGVTQGYVYNLELVGVGYKASLEGRKLVLKLGFSHDINHPIPDGVSITCQKPTFISITGIDKQLVSQEAAIIRSYKSPEPYKGKGIIYENEILIRKEGKKK